LCILSLFGANVSKNSGVVDLVAGLQPGEGRHLAAEAAVVAA
jgi:hypothetical protein